MSAMSAIIIPFPLARRLDGIRAHEARPSQSNTGADPKLADSIRIMFETALAEEMPESRRKFVLSLRQFWQERGFLSQRQLAVMKEMFPDLWIPVVNRYGRMVARTMKKVATKKRRRRASGA